MLGNLSTILILPSLIPSALLTPDRVRAPPLSYIGSWLSIPRLPPLDAPTATSIQASMKIGSLDSSGHSSRNDRVWTLKPSSFVSPRNILLLVFSPSESGPSDFESRRDSADRVGMLDGCGLLEQRRYRTRLKSAGTATKSIRPIAPPNETLRRRGYVCRNGQTYSLSIDRPPSLGDVGIKAVARKNRHLALDQPDGD